MTKAPSKQKHCDFFQIFLSQNGRIPLKFKLFLPFDLSCRTYTETDSDLSSFPDDFQVAKYAIFEKVGPRCACDAAGTGPVPFSTSYFVSFVLLFSTKENSKTWCVVELQSCSVGEGRKYRVVRYGKEDISTKVCESFPTLLL